MSEFQSQPRRVQACLRALVLSALTLFTASCSGPTISVAKGLPNILLITADDLSYDSVGSYGCVIPQITPHIDRLASGGMRLTQAHVNIAVCQPSRQSIMTGRYPHRNGAEGFDPIHEDVPTLQESLRAAGYLNGILGKEVHLKPKHKYCWDYYITQLQLASGAGIGRSPKRYFEYSTSFFEAAKRSGKPFFLMANIHDPHRPFAVSRLTSTVLERSIRTVPPFFSTSVTIFSMKSILMAFCGTKTLKLRLAHHCQENCGPSGSGASARASTDFC